MIARSLVVYVCYVIGLGSVWKDAPDREAEKVERALRFDVKGHAGEFAAHGECVLLDMIVTSAADRHDHGECLLVDILMENAMGMSATHMYACMSTRGEASSPPPGSEYTPTQSHKLRVRCAKDVATPQSYHRLYSAPLRRPHRHYRLHTRPVRGVHRRRQAYARPRVGTASGRHDDE